MNNKQEVNAYHEGAKKVSLTTIIKDAFTNIGSIKKILLFDSLIVCSFILLNYFGICEINNIIEQILNIFGTILGFIITGYTIVIGCSSTVIKRLSTKANDGKIPFDAICASFSFNLIFTLLTISSSLLYELLKLNLIYYITLILLVVSISLLFDLVFHLFAFRTFLKDYNK